MSDDDRSKEMKMLLAVKNASSSFSELFGAATIGPRIAAEPDLGMMEDEDDNENGGEWVPPVESQAYGELQSRVKKQRFQGEVHALSLVHSVESLLNLCLNLKASYILHDEDKHIGTSQEIALKCTQGYERNQATMQKVNTEVMAALATLEDHLATSLV